MVRFTCPQCESHFFGTSNCTGKIETWVRHCHGYKQDGQPCRFRFPIADDDKYFADDRRDNKEIGMELRKEYEGIRNSATAFGLDNGSLVDALQIAVERCQKLADRPPRELTDAEISAAHESVQDFKSNSDNINPYWLKGVRAVIAAHIAKQREPDSEPLDLEKLKTGEWELLIDGNSCKSIDMEYYCEDPQRYTMRRKS